MELVVTQAKLELVSIAGGFPGHIDKMKAFLQNPAMVKRVPVEAKEEFLQQERDWGAADDGETPIDIIKTGFRQLPDGRPFIGAYQVKACLQGAARTLYNANTKPSSYQVPRAVTFTLEVLPTEIVIEGGRSGGVKRINQIISQPRTPTIKIPSIRERDIWLGGTITLFFVVLSTSILNEHLEDMLEAAGMFVGLGTDRGYGYGRFKLLSFEKVDPDVVEIPGLVWNPRRKGIGYKKKSKAASKV